MYAQLSSAVNHCHITYGWRAESQVALAGPVILPPGRGCLPSSSKVSISSFAMEKGNEQRIKNEKALCIKHMISLVMLLGNQLSRERQEE